MKNYNEMSSRELRKIGQELKIKGYGSAGKAYLISEIKRIKAEKSKKQTKAKLYEYNGKTQTLKQWSDELGIPLPTLNGRINRRGWTIEEAFENKSGAKTERLYEYNGKSQSLGKWAKELGISINTLHGRINKLGWSVEKAFTTRKEK